MVGDARRFPAPGPFRAEQIRSGDPYELSDGHPLYCAPTGRDGAGPKGLGFAVLDSDPAVRNAGVDAGMALSTNTLRAPDVAVNLEHEGGTWATRAPLVVEYTGRGQDEAELATKIAELIGAGTRWVWVVRLVGPRRVEVHEAGLRAALMGALAARGWALSEEQAQRVAACRDGATLMGWIARAVTAASSDGVFAGA